jgi:hypothetical protein
MDTGMERMMDFLRKSRSRIVLKRVDTGIRMSMMILRTHVSLTSRSSTSLK